MSSLKKLFEHSSKQKIIEYGLIAVLLAIVIILAATTVGSNLQSVYSTIAAHF